MQQQQHQQQQQSFDVAAQKPVSEPPRPRWADYASDDDSDGEGSNSQPLLEASLHDKSYDVFEAPLNESNLNSFSHATRISEEGAEGEVNSPGPNVNGASNENAGGSELPVAAAAAASVQAAAWPQGSAQPVMLPIFWVAAAPVVAVSGQFFAAAPAPVAAGWSAGAAGRDAATAAVPPPPASARSAMAATGKHGRSSRKRPSQLRLADLKRPRASGVASGGRGQVDSAEEVMELEEGLEAPDALPKASEEVWKLRAERRRAAVALVKRSPEYGAKAERSQQEGALEPQTPTPLDRISKRRWEEEIRQWKMALRANMGNVDA